MTTTDIPFIGGPLAGRLASGGQALYRSATDGSALRADYGDRWVLGHRDDDHEIEPGCLEVANRVADIYIRQSSTTFWTAYVWAPIFDIWLASGRPDIWRPIAARGYRRRAAAAAAAS